jgi:hypothetical protein
LAIVSLLSLDIVSFGFPKKRSFETWTFDRWLLRTTIFSCVSWNAKKIDIGFFQLRELEREKDRHRDRDRDRYRSDRDKKDAKNEKVRLDSF